MNFRNRLAAVEAIIRRWPAKCKSCGRGSLNTPGVVVLRQAEGLGQCLACGGYLSPSGASVGQVLHGQTVVTAVLLKPALGAVAERPSGKEQSV